MKFSDLKDVNLQINDDSTYVSDHEQYGRAEVWTNITITKKGDCEDYAIGKIRALIALGWTIENLRLCKCYVEPIKVIDEKTGILRDATMAERYHGVLLATLDGVDWILDNRKPYPVEASMSEYILDIVQVPGTVFFQKALIC